ncbi:hypothetical protein [Sphingomonas sanguinis]|uniref:Uncharacterized protein n=1 Tax=Sphingomonas sanguinis TaxID=33051 RepID=A0A147IM87_9SPHN|nr:hypothetical protein [Sphingomonas sanguinis]KTT96136.1 hypothetical protein SB4_16320 [Sphingomonas sanguinis]
MMNEKLHRRRARRAWPKLVAAAKHGETVSYSDLSASIGEHWRAASWFLGVIQRYCAEMGLPRLQALAVNKRTRVPGKGYAGKRGKRAHRREIDRVRAASWPAKAPF